MSKVNEVTRKLHNLLLIDDDLVSREVLATLLTMSGLAVHTAEDGDSAIDILSRAKCVPELILMDAQMPGLKGVQLISELRKLTRAPIFTMSASCPDSSILENTDGFLLKPFGPDELQDLLNARMEGSADGGSNLPSSRGSNLTQGDEIVHLETLAQLRRLMPESAIREIFIALVADLAFRINALQAAIAKGDGALARRIGHAIKGGSDLAGAVQVARLGALIESGALEVETGLDTGYESGFTLGHNQMDINSYILRDLRSAAENLERMLREGFPA